MRTLYLDLEDTVITPVEEGWHTAELTQHIPAIRDFIERWKPVDIHVFSFAIYDEKDRLAFQQQVQVWLERALGARIGAALTMYGQIIPACCRATGIHPEALSFADVVCFWGKAGAFRLYMQTLLEAEGDQDTEREVALIDDVVTDEVFYWPDWEITGQIINVNNVGKFPHEAAKSRLARP